LVLALVAVYPIMGAADQAFQVIQEYSGFVYPGVVVIFGLGLLWKRASGVAAVVAAIGTFAFSVLFKFVMPEVPFLIRMGYVFIALVVLFITLSLLSKKTVKADEMDANTVKTQLKWGRILLYSGILLAVLGLVQKIAFACGGHMATLQFYGFEAIFFLAAAFVVLGIYLNSNAKDKVQDPKAIGVDLALFRTDRTFNIGAICVIALLAVLYILLW
ncbi:MAG: sodium/glucose cotransporter, partial [Bacteroidales bacterium]|nr:sodium/glucose cotransporter [Bacteroidales bacterium]